MLSLMANDVPAGIPLSFEHFCVLAQLEPAEVAELAKVAPAGEIPLRGWLQLAVDKVGLRLPRQPLESGTPSGSAGRDGKDGVGIRAVGVSEDRHLLVTLTDGTVQDAGFLGNPCGGGGGGGADLPPGEGFLERHLQTLQMTPLLVEEVTERPGQQIVSGYAYVPSGGAI